MKAKAGILAGIAAAAVAAAAVCASAVGATLRPGAVEVVVAPDAPPSVAFAADEMTNFLSRTLRAAVPVAASPSLGKCAVFLGDSPQSRAAGIDVSKMRRDGFAIVAEGDRVFIAGRDDPKADTRRAVFSPDTGVWAQLHEHATLFGVYEFLERYAGVRMYFPGELGEVVPAKDAVEVPPGRIDVAPDFTARSYSAFADGAWYEGTAAERGDRLLPARKLNYTRNRMQTLYVPCCHGSRNFMIQERFGASHPEYAALCRKGGALVRDTDPGVKSHHFGQLCHSSAVYDEIFRDIESYARGEGPEARGLGKRWPIATFRRPWVDVMPQDGFVECMCGKCQTAYVKTDRHYATELVWGRTVELANRLKAAGIDGIRVTQMAYTPYRRIPAFDIPDNVDVMVAEPGPWSAPNPAALAREYAEIRGWKEKLGRKVWIWVYPNKFGNRVLPDVPNGTPRAWAKYLKDVSPWIFGAYAECENDRALYNALAYHVMGKVCWDADAAPDAIIDEFNRLMFGAAAGPMAEFFDEIERKWLDEVAGNLVETDEGPARQMPSEYALFTRIYSPEVLERWRRLLGGAERAAGAGTLEARRVALFRDEFFAPLAKAVAAYGDSASVEAELKRRAASGKANLLVNGDFDAPPCAASKRHFGFYDDPAKGRGWRGGWICKEADAAKVSVIDDAPPGAAGKAARLSQTGEAGSVALEAHFPARFRPGAAYRVSYFTRLTDVESRGDGGGAGVRVWHDRNEWFPRNRMTGTTDWVHQEFRFTAGPNSSGFRPQFTLLLKNATGAVDFAGVRIEEE